MHRLSTPSAPQVSKSAEQVADAVSGTEKWRIEMTNHNHTIISVSGARVALRFPYKGIWREPTTEDKALAERICALLNGVSSQTASAASPVAGVSARPKLRSYPAHGYGFIACYETGEIDAYIDSLESQIATLKGDGWIAASKFFPPDCKSVRLRAKNLRRTHTSPYKWQDGEYDGFYDHTEGEWNCYTGPHDSAHLWDCDVDEWLPTPPSVQEEKGSSE